MTDEALARSHERCAWHGSREAVAYCVECGRAICSTCHRVEPIGLANCPECRAEDDQTAGVLRPVPFEDESNKDNLLVKVAVTLKAQVLTPADFYTRLASSEAVLKPLVLAYVCLVLGLTMGYGYQMVLGGPGHEVMVQVAEDMGQTAKTLELIRLAVVPLEAIFRIGFYTALLHFAARLVGGTGKLKKTFQIYAYSSVANLLLVIPVVGAIIALAVQVMAQFAGLRVLHGLTPGRAALACIIPLTMALLGGTGAA